MFEYVLAYSVGAVLLVIAGVFLLRPIKLVLKTSLKCAFGFFLIVIFNLFSAVTGLSLGVNLATAVTAGVLGLPGLAMMLALKIFL